MRKNRVSAVMVLITCVCFFSIGDGYSAEIGGMQIHGYIAQGYLQSTDYDAFVSGTEEGTFQFGEMGLTFSTYATENLHLGMQFLARDFGDIGNDEIIMDWAFGDYHWKDYVGLRGGLIKVPFGFYNETRDVDMLRTFIFLPSSVYSESYRGAYSRIKGLSLYGTVPGGFSYQALYGNSDMKQDDPLAEDIIVYIRSLDPQAEITYLKNGDAVDINLQWESMFGLKLGATYLYLNGIELDVSTSIGDQTVEFEELSCIVGSIEYQYGNLNLAAEYAKYKVALFVRPLNIPREAEPEGCYVSASFRFTSWLTIGTYYNVFYKYKDDRDIAENFQNQWVLTTRFDINENWILKLEAQMMDGLYYATHEDGTQAKEEFGDDEDWYLFAAKLCFSF